MATASGIERLMLCAPSEVFPASDGESGDAERGSELHAFMKRTRRMSLTAALALVPKEYRDACAAIPLEKVYGGLHGLRVEVAYALRVGHEEALCIGEDIDRRYPTLPEGFICGTNDFEGQRFDGCEVVADIKTGNDVTPCAKNPQAMFHARVRQLVTGADEVEARIVYVRPSGRVTVDWHVFTRFELDRFEAKLEAAIATVRATRELFAAGAIPKVTPGAHCRYCPAIASCPAQASLARAMVGDIAEVSRMLSSLTPEQAGLAWLKLEKFNQLAERVREGLELMAHHAPLPLGDGREVRPLTVTSKTFSQSRAIDLLKRKGVTTAELASCFDEHESEQVRALKVRSFR